MSDVNTHSNSKIIQLDQVAVRYRVPKERIPSIKEYAIRWLKRDIGYETFWALQDIDLQLERGDGLGIIGPNGAGKSTLLKVISRVIRPTKGRVRVNGRVAPLLELGAGFDHELTGRENIYLNGTILGASKKDIDSRIDRIIDFSGLEEFIDAPLRNYSTGMVARLGFSIATDVQPEILIVDEILGVGDAEFRTKSYERIQGFLSEGTTIILVSHDLPSIEKLCSTAVWLDHGKIVQKGTSKSVISHYQLRTMDQESDRLDDDRGPTEDRRWGSRTIEITSVQFVDESEQPKHIFNTGDCFHIDIEYHSHEDVRKPTFGLAVHRQDGVHVTGPNNGNMHNRPDVAKGKGKVRFTVPSLPLLEGLYHVSVAVVNHDDSEIFDYHDRAYPFRVANLDGDEIEKLGLLTMKGNWEYLE